MEAGLVEGSPFADRARVAVPFGLGPDLSERVVAVALIDDLWRIATVARHLEVIEMIEMIEMREMRENMCQETTVD